VKLKRKIMIQDVYEDETINVWRDEEYYHVHLCYRGIVIDFHRDDWIELLASFRNLFYKESK